VVGAEGHAAQALPSIQSFTLHNGLTVYVLERHTFRHVGVGYVSLNGGEDSADLDLAGLSSVVHQMLLSADSEPGTSARSMQPAASGTAASLLSVAFDGEVLQHVSYVSTLVESGELSPTLGLLADIVLRPDLSANALERARKRARLEWNDERYSELGLARNYLMQRIYGPMHVLGQHADRAVKRVDEHPLERVVTGYHERHAPASSVLLMVGDVTLEQARELAEREFGAWQEPKTNKTTYAPSSWQPQGKRKIFVHARSRPVRVALGQRAPSPSSPDYAATELLTHLLGGSFGSRLMTTLRVHQNLTYHASAELSPRRDGSTLLIETAVPNDDAERALQLVLGELRRLQNEAVSERELNNAKRGLIERELAQYETTGGALKQMIMQLELGQDPAQATIAHVDAMRSVDGGALQAAARRVLAPESAPIVIIGDLNWGTELHEWSANDDETF
jgi:zinc protease